MFQLLNSMQLNTKTHFTTIFNLPEQRSTRTGRALAGARTKISVLGVFEPNLSVTAKDKNCHQKYVNVKLASTHSIAK